MYPIDNQVAGPNTRELAGSLNYLPSWPAVPVSIKIKPPARTILLTKE